jgi:hypothetical protein
MRRAIAAISECRLPANVLAGSRPGGGGTLVLAKVPKAICACAIARKSQRVPCAPCRLRGSRQGTSLCLAWTREIPSTPVPAVPSPSSVLGSAKGAQKNTTPRSSRTSAQPLLGCLSCFSSPLLKPREEGERRPSTKWRGKEPPRSPQAQGPVSWANLLSQAPSEGTPHVKYTCGAQSLGCPFFRFLSLGMQRKEPVVRGRNPGSKQSPVGETNKRSRAPRAPR